LIQITKLEALEIQQQDEYNQISNVTDDATASNSTQPETMNELKQAQVKAKTDLLCVKYVAGNIADKRDAALAKQLRKLYKKNFLVDYPLNLF
jgi:pyridoxal biosynthesis lyase PdxS